MSIAATRCTRRWLGFVGLAIGLSLNLAASAQEAAKDQGRIAAPDSSGEHTGSTRADGKKDPGRIGGQAPDHKADSGAPEILYDPALLPEPVRDMRRRILSAAFSGELENLRPVLESNELMPAFSFGDDTDPIAYWKQISRDSAGREILAEMIKVFSSGYARMDAGTDEELYVWPYHFARPLTALTPRQTVELLLLVNPDDAKTMEESGGYFGYRGGISPDGTWQFFLAGD